MRVHHKKFKRNKCIDYGFKKSASDELDNMSESDANDNKFNSDYVSGNNKSEKPSYESEHTKSNQCDNSESENNESKKLSKESKKRSKKSGLIC